MSYTAELTRHYAAVRSRLMGREDRFEFHEVDEPMEVTFLPPPPQQHWRQIVEEVACKHGVTVVQLLGRSRRTKNAVAARFEAMWRIRDEVKLPLFDKGGLPAGRRPATTTEIGRWMGGRDHSSVCHGIKKHVERTGG